MTDIEKREAAVAALRAAVIAKLAYLYAMNALETALGFPDGDVPDAIDSALVTEVENYAAACYEVNWIDDGELTSFLTVCGVIL